MPIVGHRFVRLASNGSFIGSLTVNFAPASVVVQAALNSVIGGGAHKVGIKSFRFRTSSGADEDVDFGEWPFWPATANHDRMTSVTFGVATGSNQSMEAFGNIFFWA